MSLRVSAVEIGGPVIQAVSVKETTTIHYTTATCKCGLQMQSESIKNYLM